MATTPRPARRIDQLAPSSLRPDQAEVYAAIALGRRAQGPKLYQLLDEQGRLEGPFNAFLLQPRLGGPLQEVGAAIRYRTDLSDRAREIAVLVVAEHWRADYIRYAHEAIGRQIGLTDAGCAAIRAGRSEEFEGTERVVAEATRALVRDGDLDDTAYAAVLDALGEPGVFELTTLVGYYAILALQLRVFRVPLPEDVSLGDGPFPGP